MIRFGKKLDVKFDEDRKQGKTRCTFVTSHSRSTNRNMRLFQTDPASYADFKSVMKRKRF